MIVRVPVFVGSPGDRKFAFDGLKTCEQILYDAGRDVTAIRSKRHRGKQQPIGERPVNKSEQLVRCGAHSFRSAADDRDTSK